MPVVVVGCFLFDKHNPNTLFIDKRSETVTAKNRDKIRTIEVKSDVVADFTNLPFEDNSFYMVVLPHRTLKHLAKHHGWQRNTVNFSLIAGSN